ncbi:MAG: tetratricopeptide repeat protein [Spirochaetaceae bacterium]|nr:tetratricopeptide repeat protein [Spirochaetaceae bacterium]
MSRYNEDLDNLIRVMDITDGELEEIIREADSTLAGQNADGDQKIRALLKKAQALQKLNKHDESREYVDQILKLKPEMPEALVRRGNIYNKKKEHGEALEDYSRAIELNPDDALAYHNRGIAYGRMGKHGKAVEDYSRAIELQPDDAEAYYNRGTAYGRMGKHGKAVDDLSRAIGLKPDDAAAYYNRSLLFCREEKYDKAFQDEIKCFEYIQQSDARDVIAKTQWVVGVIIKNSENLDFIWDYPEEALKKVPHFFPWIIASFIKEGFIGKKYKKLVNAVFRLWKGCYDADSDEDGRPVILYQYTTMPALRAMFENRCLRLSPVSYLNDPNEGTTFFTCLKESANTKELKAYLEKIQEKETGNRDIIFIRSFTGNEDKLVMWDSSYADNGRGVSVGVPAPLVDKGRGTPEPISLMINAGTAKPDDEEEAGQPIPLELLGLFKIRYNRDSVGEIAGCLEEFKRADFKDETLVELLARLFVPVAALIKGEEYRHENEYRLVCITSWKEAAFRKYIKQTEEDGVYIETEAILFQEPDEEDDGPEEEYVEVYMGPKVDKITWLKWRDRFRYKYAAVKNVQQSKIEWR